MTTQVSVDEAIRIVGAGATNLISEADLRKKMARGQPLRIKLGIDPTASDQAWDRTTTFFHHHLERSETA